MLMRLISIHEVGREEGRGGYSPEGKLVKWSEYSHSQKFKLQ
jgi:hypothetical protein